MAGNTQEEKICEAIETIVDKRIADADYDKTEEATIIKCEDSKKGIQRVLCHGAKVTALAAESEKPLYNENEKVLVLYSPSLGNRYILSTSTAESSNTKQSNENFYNLQPITSMFIASNVDYTVYTNAGTERYVAQLDDQA